MFSSERPLIMGILNVTPDSFSDGGQFLNANDAILHGKKMHEAGAHIVDIGGESTRPGASPVDEEEEAKRVLPVVAGLAQNGITVSIDTRKPVVAERALKAGAIILNDVTGFRNPAMQEVARRHAKAICIMHMKGEPRTMQENPTYNDVVQEVLDFLLEKASAMESLGFRKEQIWIDPGIGFGKTLEQNLTLLRELPRFIKTGYPVLVGASRKSMIAKLSGDAAPEDRLPGSLTIALQAAMHGVQVLRVHDVPETIQALCVAKAVGLLRETSHN